MSHMGLNRFNSWLAPAPEACHLLIQALENSSDDSSYWVSATAVGYLDSVSKSGQVKFPSLLTSPAKI